MSFEAALACYTLHSNYSDKLSTLVGSVSVDVDCECVEYGRDTRR